MHGSGRWQYAVVAGEVVVAWFAILIVMLGLGWLLTEGLKGSIGPRDTDFSQWLADQRTPTLTDLAEIGGTGGDTITICAIAAVVAVGTSLWARSVRPLVFMVVGLVGQALVYDLTSRLVTRQRPPVNLLDHGLDPNASYPSGHVSTSVMFFGGVVALVWTYASPRWRAPAALLLIVPLVVGAARLYQGAHHVTDALASLIVMPWWVVALTVLILRSQFETEARSSP
jgi:membrane-associated phospholipid phosphatase